MRLEGSYTQYITADNLVTHENATAQVDENGIIEMGNLFSCIFEIKDSKGIVIQTFPMAVNVYSDDQQIMERAMYEQAQYHMLPDMKIIE